MYFTSGQDRAFERLMQEKPGFDHYDCGGANAPENCGSCRFYRPDWKYQYCVYAECPYQPGKLTALAAGQIYSERSDDDMAVFRVEKNKGYTVMSNHHLRNKVLSLKAKGLLSQMLSLPEDWDYTLKGLSLINRESIDAIRTAVWELERAGYIRREQGRDAKGKMADMVYTIYEQPVLDKPVLENPVLENPTSDNPTSDNPASGNPTQLNKEIQKTNLPRKEKLNTDKADIEGLSAFVETDLSDKGSIDAAFGVLPQVIDRFFGVAGLSGARTSYWLTFTVNFIANKYMTDTYLEKRIPSGGSIAYVTSCGGLMWEKWRKEYVKVMDCKTWDEMVAFMKSVSPKDGVGVMAYTLSKRAMNYYTSLKAVELGKRGIRVNALLPGSTDTGMKKEFEKMAGGQDNLIKENGGAGRLATPQEMADPLLFLNSGMAAFVSGLLLIADMGHNCEKTLGFCKNQLDVPAALKLYNTKFFQNKLKTNQ